MAQVATPAVNLYRVVELYATWRRRTDRITRPRGGESLPKEDRKTAW